MITNKCKLCMYVLHYVRIDCDALVLFESSFVMMSFVFLGFSLTSHMLLFFGFDSRHPNTRRRLTIADFIRYRRQKVTLANHLAQVCPQSVSFFGDTLHLHIQLQHLVIEAFCRLRNVLLNKPDLLLPLIQQGFVWF